MAGLTLATPAPAAELLVTTRTVYPRDVIVAEMLATRSVARETAESGFYVTSLGEAIGKVARRTVLKGSLLPSEALGPARLIVNGGQVRIVFRAGGIQITAYGAAMQDGASGELIRVRNADSGIIVSGIVQADATVLVGENG